MLDGNENNKNELPLEELRETYSRKNNAQRKDYISAKLQQQQTEKSYYAENKVEKTDADEEQDIPIADLRALYLKRGGAKKARWTSPNIPKETAALNKSQAVPITEDQTCMDANNCLSQENSNYVAKMPANSRCLSRLICDLVLLICVFTVTVTTFVWFSNHTIEIGGEIFRDKTQNIYAFLYSDQNSIISQIDDCIDKLSSTGSSLDDIASSSGAATEIFRLSIILAICLSTIVGHVSNLILSIIYFFTKKSIKLGSTAISNITQNFAVYIEFALFGCISGGIGDDSYFVGYRPAFGMSVGIVIGLFLILGVSLYNRVTKTSDTDDRAKLSHSWNRALFSSLGCLLITLCLINIRMNSVFSYVITSPLTVLAGGIINELELKSLIFPLFNFLLLFAYIFMYARTSKVLQRTLKYLLAYGEKDNNGIRETTKLKKYTYSFIPTIVFSLISIGIVWILTDPNYGYGWSVDIYKQLLYIFVCSSITQTAISAFTAHKKDSLE